MNQKKIGKIETRLNKIANLKPQLPDFEKCFTQLSSEIKELMAS